MQKVKLLEVIRDAEGGMKKHMEMLLSGIDLKHYDVTLACSDNQFDSSQLKKQGIRTYEINLGDTRKLSVLKSLGSLINIIKDEDIHVIHAHGMMCAIICSIAALLSSSRPQVVSTLHNFPIFKSDTKRRIFGLLAAPLFRSNSEIIVVSRALKDYIQPQWKIPRDKIHVIYNGIDVNDIVEKAEREISTPKPESPFVVLTIARLIADKGVDVLLKSAALLITENPSLAKRPLIFRIAGDGPEMSQLKKTAQELGIEEYVEFLGFRKDIYGVIKSSDVVVLCSRNEGLGISLLEAMALRKPVIASKVGGIPEIINDGVTGILVSPDDPQELSRAIAHIFCNDKLAQRMGEEGYKNVQSHFLKNIMLKDIQNVLSMATRGKKA